MRERISLLPRLLAFIGRTSPFLTSVAVLLVLGLLPSWASANPAPARTTPNA